MIAESEAEALKRPKARRSGMSRGCSLLATLSAANRKFATQIRACVMDSRVGSQR